MNWFPLYEFAGTYWRKTQYEIKASHDYKTADGKPIRVGMTVYNENNMPATVIGVTPGEFELLCQNQGYIGGILTCSTGCLWRCWKSCEWNRLERFVIQRLIEPVCGIWEVYREFMHYIEKIDKRY